MNRPSVSNVVVALILLFGGYSLGQRQGPVQVITVRDTVATAQYVRTVADLRMQRNGLRAQLAGVRELQPQRIVVTDTIFTPPDTVLSFITIREGTLSTEVLLKVPESGIQSSGWKPEFHTGFDVSSCDDGLEVSANGVVCNRPRFGHLFVGPVLAQDPSLAAWWIPSYRSPWEISVGRTQTSWVFSIRRGIKIW